MNIVFTECHYPIVKEINWDDVVEKISKEAATTTILWDDFILNPPLSKDTNKNLTIYTYNNPPTFLMKGDYYPGSIGEVFNHISTDSGVKKLHIYASLGKHSVTFNRHVDPVDVLLVQSKGTATYKCDDNTYTLNPGDSLLMPKGYYHEPVINESRITLSFSWE